MPQWAPVSAFAELRANHLHPAMASRSSISCSLSLQTQRPSSGRRPQQSEADILASSHVLGAQGSKLRTSVLLGLR